MDPLFEAVLPFLEAAQQALQGVPNPQGGAAQAAQGEAAQAAQEAPAPADAPVPHLSPQQLKLEEIHNEVKKKYFIECLRGKRWLRASLLKPEMQELQSQVATKVLKDLEISAEMDTYTLNEWLQEIKENPKLLKPLLSEYLPTKK